MMDLGALGGTYSVPLVSIIAVKSLDIQLRYSVWSTHAFLYTPSSHSLPAILNLLLGV